MTVENEFGQPVGAPMPHWTPRPMPSVELIEGRWCRLERLDPTRHADDLLAADSLDAQGTSWTYLPYGPYLGRAEHRAWLDSMAELADPFFHVVVDTDPDGGSGRAVGVLALMRIRPEDGVVEVGHVHYSPLLTRRRGATEAQYLMMRHVFDDLGYRRYEWRCHALNSASRAAADRLGFRLEGIHRQDRVAKGRNRDTAWFSILDGEWPAVRTALRHWLTPDNFDAGGRQRMALDARGGRPD